MLRSEPTLSDSRGQEAFWGSPISFSESQFTSLWTTDDDMISGSPGGHDGGGHRKLLVLWVLAVHNKPPGGPWLHTTRCRRVPQLSWPRLRHLAVLNLTGAAGLGWR